MVRLAHGSITKAESTAIVVSHFKGIVPGGAEAAVDQALRGAITRFVENNDLRGEIGEFFPVPALTGELSAQVAVVMGLGDFDVFVKKMRDKKGNDPELMRKVALRLIQVGTKEEAQQAKQRIEQNAAEADKERQKDAAKGE